MVPVVSVYNSAAAAFAVVAASGQCPVAQMTVDLVRSVGTFVVVAASVDAESCHQGDLSVLLMTGESTSAEKTTVSCPQNYPPGNQSNRS